MSEGEPAVEVAGLTKQFGNVSALRSASVRVEAGECVAVFGRNGAGKTTLLRIIAGLIRSYRGSVRVFGHDVRGGSNDARRRTGFVSHEMMSYGDLTIYDNLLFFAKLYKLTDRHRRVNAAIDEAGLGDKRLSIARTLSRGMKQRLSIARAFLHEPDLLLLDEPFTGLDDSAVGALDARLNKFHGGGGSSLIVTHSPELGWRHARRVVVLEHGAVAHETLTAETSLEGFLSRYRDLLGASPA